MMSLFHDDNHVFFDMERLEQAAFSMISNLSLVRRCRDGDGAAAIALSRGFWPFTRDFEKAIDRRANSSSLSRDVLYAKFGRGKARTTLAESAKAIRTLQDQEIAGVFEEARANLVEMQKDEFRHSKHWEADARNLGIDHATLQSEPALPGVQRLIDATASGDLVEFFGGVLAPTEFVAEALGAILAHAPGYTSLFQRGRAIWMEVHTVPHDGEPSHEEIVMDFARAYDMSGSPERIEELVMQGLALFEAAAIEVEAYYGEAMSIAAEWQKVGIKPFGRSRGDRERRVWSRHDCVQQSRGCQHSSIARLERPCSTRIVQTWNAPPAKLSRNQAARSIVMAKLSNGRSL